MGIDGGGSTLRLTIVDTNMDPVSTVTGKSVNPSLIGRDKAQALIRRSIAEVLRRADMLPQAIAAVGIGIAGASNLHSQAWLTQTIAPALPESLLIASSDLEIALVGALAQRHGILLLAGTGSAVYGVSPAGRRLQIGGWGFLLGDEGSSYWIGLQLLRHIIDEYDSGAVDTSDTLSCQCLQSLGIAEPRELIAWLYRAEEAPAVRVASLGKLVIDAAASVDKHATSGSKTANRILNTAADKLVRQLEIMQRRLDYPDAPIAFAGGLLDKGNYLSEAVAAQLGLAERPRAKHLPVVGAALLAKMEWSAANSR